MKVTTLGCWGGYAYKDAGTTSFLVQSEDGFNLLMDAGSRAVTELEKEISPLELDAVIISHYHADHVADLGVLRQYRQLYPKHLWEAKVLPIYGHTEDPEEFAKLTLTDVSQGHAYDVVNGQTIGPFDISFIRTVHPVPCYAFRICERQTGQVLVFTGDTGYFPELPDFVKGADLFLADVYFFEGNERHIAHLTSKEAGEIAHEAKVKRLVLTHLPQFGPSDLTTTNHLESLRQQAQTYAGDIPVELAAPHRSFQVGL